MNAAAKLDAYGITLAAALGGGAAVGSAVRPVDVAESDGNGHDAHSDDSAAVGDESGPADKTEDALPGGVLTSQAGYTLEADDTVLDGVARTPFWFRITGPDGSVVTDFDARHERELHLILVGRDLATFAHLHPVRGADGTWTAELPALEPGSYRADADVAPAGGPELTLGVDLAVPGQFQPAPLAEAGTTVAIDGYDVTLAGTPAAGTAGEVALTVAHGGEPVEDLEPYLGAFGHLVAIRAGDLAYLHVHPLDQGDDRGGPSVRFAVDVPSPGDYRLFFDFAHHGEVRTAAFTVHVPARTDVPAIGDDQNAHGADTPEEDQ